MSKVVELRAELDRVESAAGELTALEETKAKLITSLDGLVKFLLQAKTVYNKGAGEYAEVLVMAQELNEKGQELSRITGQHWQGIDLPRQYGYPGNILNRNDLTLSVRSETGKLAIHESLVPAVFGAEVFELLKEKRARK